MGVVWVVEIDLISVREIGIDFDFSVEIGLYLVFVWGVENDLFSVSGSKLARLLCRGIEIGLIKERGSKLTRFKCWGRN